MSIMKALKASYLAARKNRDTATVSSLSTLIGDAEAIGKRELRDTTDAEISALLKKYVKNTQETLTAVGTAGSGGTDLQTFQIRIYELEKEIALFSSFLPEQLTTEKLTAVINGIISSNPGANVGVVMKSLKDNYAGLYDGAAASALIKAALV